VILPSPEETCIFKGATQSSKVVLHLSWHSFISMSVGSFSMTKNVPGPVFNQYEGVSAEEKCSIQEEVKKDPSCAYVKRLTVGDFDLISDSACLEVDETRCVVDGQYRRAMKFLERFGALRGSVFDANKKYRDAINLLIGADVSISCSFSECRTSAEQRLQNSFETSLTSQRTLRRDSKQLVFDNSTSSIINSILLGDDEERKTREVVSLDQKVFDEPLEKTTEKSKTRQVVSSLDSSCRKMHVCC